MFSLENDQMHVLGGNFLAEYTVHFGLQSFRVSNEIRGRSLIVKYQMIVSFCVALLTIRLRESRSFL